MSKDEALKEIEALISSEHSEFCVTSWDTCGHNGLLEKIKGALNV